MAIHVPTFGGYEVEDAPDGIGNTPRGTTCPFVEHRLLEVAVSGTTSLRIRIGFIANQPARLGYRVSGSTGPYQYTGGELSSNFGAVGNEHLQLISGLTAGTSYEIVSQTTLDNAVTWVDVSCPTIFTTDSIMTSGDNIPPESIDAFWNSLGYEREWGDTPKAADVGMRFDDYIETPHWSNGNSPTFSSNDSDNLIQLAPDGTPAICSTIFAPPSATRSLSVHGRQFGNDGLQKRSVVMYHEFYTDTPENGGVSNPLARPGGMYMLFGHHIFSRVGSTANSAGSNYQSGASSFRISIGNSSQYFIWSYIKQFDTTGTGRSFFGNPVVALFNQGINENVYNRWVPMALEVVLNDPNQNNGELRMYVDGVLIHEQLNLEIREFSDQYLKGFGLYHEVTGGNNLPADETLYSRNNIVYSKD